MAINLMQKKKDFLELATQSILTFGNKKWDLKEWEIQQVGTVCTHLQ